jgi:hypothetical protein
LDKIADKATIIPIPNSDIVSQTQGGFKTLELAKEIAARSGGRLTAVPALVFKEAQVKSRDGGPRSP